MNIKQLQIELNKVSAAVRALFMCVCKLVTESSRREVVNPVPLKEEELLYIRRGHEALTKALDIVEDKNGWKTELTEVVHHPYIHTSSLIKEAIRDLYIDFCQTIMYFPFKICCSMCSCISFQSPKKSYCYGNLVLMPNHQTVI